MAITKKDLQAVIDKLEDGNYTCYFYLPDFEKESGGIKVSYDHVKCMNENGFKAVVLHQKTGFLPNWLKDYYKQTEDGTFENIPIKYLDDGNLPINMEDFFFIPEGFPELMENLMKQNAPCKRIVFCQNWYYVLNSLPPGVFWDSFKMHDCMSVSHSQSEYLRMIMPFLRIKNVVGNVSSDTFKAPEKDSNKKLQIAFIPSRDGGMKSYNVIKTFYAVFPYLRFIQFRELKGLPKDAFVNTLKECAFYIHFDEYSSWGTAPIEAYLSKCLVAGWDGVGGREYMNTDNTWIVPNGDIMRLALAIGNMVEAYIMYDIPDKTWQAMEKATLMYTKEAERDSVIQAHNEYRDERIAELSELMKMIPQEEKINE